MTLYMMVAMMPNEPLFTNDLAGFIKIIALIVSIVLLPLAALVVYFLKRGPDNEIRELRGELNGLGTRVNNLGDDVVRLEESMATIQSSITESQRDVMGAIQASGEAQLRAVHAVEVQVARLQERNDLGKCLTEFGSSIERLVREFQHQRGV